MVSTPLPNCVAYCRGIELEMAIAGKTHDHLAVLVLADRLAAEAPDLLLHRIGHRPAQRLAIGWD